MDRVQEIFYQGTCTVRNGESHRTVGHARDGLGLLSPSQRAPPGGAGLRVGAPPPAPLRPQLGKAWKATPQGSRLGGREFPVEV